MVIAFGVSSSTSPATSSGWRAANPAIRKPPPGVPTSRYGPAAPPPSAAPRGHPATRQPRGSRSPRSFGRCRPGRMHTCGSRPPATRTPAATRRRPTHRRPPTGSSASLHQRTQDRAFSLADVDQSGELATRRSRDHARRIVRSHRDGGGRTPARRPRLHPTMTAPTPRRRTSTSSWSASMVKLPQAIRSSLVESSPSSSIRRTLTRSRTLQLGRPRALHAANPAMVEPCAGGCRRNSITRTTCSHHGPAREVARPPWRLSWPPRCQRPACARTTG